MRASQLHAASAAIERVKAVCVVGMVAAHGFYWAATDHGRILSPPGGVLAQFVGDNMYIGLLPLLLPFTAGCSLRLRCSRPDGTAQAPGFAAVIGTVLVLLTVALFLNLAAFGPAYLAAWNVLQFIALSMLLIALLQRGGIILLAISGLLVVATADWIRTTVPFWQGPMWQRILLGDPTDFHSWPLAPWFGTVVAGWVAAHGLLQSSNDRRVRIALASAGAALVAWTAITGTLVPRFDPGNLIGPLVMNPPALYAVAVIGVGWLLTGMLALVPAGVVRPGWVRVFAGAILPIYVVHMIVGARGMTLLDRFLDREALLADPTDPVAILWLVAVPTVLVLISWLFGRYAILWWHDRRVHIQLRRVDTSSRTVL